MRDSWEAPQEILQRLAALQVFKQRLNGYSGPSKHGHTMHRFRVSRDRVLHALIAAQLPDCRRPSQGTGSSGRGARQLRSRQSPNGRIPGNISGAAQCAPLLWRRALEFVRNAVAGSTKLRIQFKIYSRSHSCGREGRWGQRAATLREAGLSTCDVIFSLRPALRPFRQELLKTLPVGIVRWLLR